MGINTHCYYSRFVAALDAGGFSDVNFRVKDKIFSGNKAFISINNECLRELIEAHTGEDPVEIEGIEPSAFSECLKLFGCAKIKISEGNCIDMLVAFVNLSVSEQYPRLYANLIEYDHLFLFS